MLTPQGPDGTADFLPRPYLRPHRPAPLPADGLGFGRGLLQIDYDHHLFARTGSWQDPLANIRYGCAALSEARTLLRRRTTLGGRGLLRGVIAAHNCGVGNVLRALRQGVDADFYTAGRDYSLKILKRSEFFQANGFD